MKKLRCFGWLANFLFFILFVAKQNFCLICREAEKNKIIETLKPSPPTGYQMVDALHVYLFVQYLYCVMLLGWCNLMCSFCVLNFVIIVIKYFVKKNIK